MSHLDRKPQIPSAPLARTGTLSGALGLALAFVLVPAACTSTEAVTSKGDAPAEGPAASDPGAIVEAEPGEPAGDQDGPRYLIGAVEETGIHHCPPPKHDIEWIELRPQLGFTSIWNTNEEQIASLLGKPAIATGREAAAPQRPALDVPLTPCPEMQMRSDWRMGPHGMRVRHGNGSGITSFKVQMLRELTELRARVEGDQVIIEFENPVPSKLEDVKLVLHYEGCYGKPGSRNETFDAGDLDRGATASHGFPTFGEKVEDAPNVRGRKGRHAAHSLRITATSDEAAFDFDVKLRNLGAQVDCPPT
jgi:hypothetical protein